MENQDRATESRGRRPVAGRVPRAAGPSRTVYRGPLRRGPAFSETRSHRSSYNTSRNRERQHHSEREIYRRRQYHPRDFTGRLHPRPAEEAKRWLDQAKCDVAAADNDIFGSKRAYEWACYKCHQVWPEYISIADSVSLQ